MTASGIVSAIFVGLVIGALGRLVLPGRQPIGLIFTILIGIVAALIGSALAQRVGIATDTPGIDWGELAVQVVLAALGVGLASAVSGRARR